MKILVPVKRVIDYNVKVRVKSDQSDVDLTNAKMSMNPFCEIAVEEAVRLKEKGVATEIVAVTVGPKACQEQLRNAMALGVDRGIHVECDAFPESLQVAKLLAKLVEQEQPGLVIIGKQAIDSDNNQTGQMLAALAGMPQGTFASEVVVKKLQNDHITIRGWYDDIREAYCRFILNVLVRAEGTLRSLSQNGECSNSCPNQFLYLLGV